MASADRVSLGDVLICSICLDTYTRPKVLPCQHTYCYSCLLNLVRDKTSVTCPECREVHVVPQTGVAAFRENLIVNNLLGLASPREEVTCEDCHLPLPVSTCDHCDTNICVKCLVKHTKLSYQIEQSIDTVRESTRSEEQKKRVGEKQLYFQECLRNVESERERMTQLFDTATQRLAESLTQRRHHFQEYFTMVTGLYREMLRHTDEASNQTSYIDDWTHKLPECKTVEALQELSNKLSDVKTAARLVGTRDDQFKFVGEPLPVDVGVFGQVQFGEAVVGIQGTYGAGLTVDDTSGYRDSARLLVADGQRSASVHVRHVETGTDFEDGNATGLSGNQPTTVRDVSSLIEGSSLVARAVSTVPVPRDLPSPDHVPRGPASPDHVPRDLPSPDHVPRGPASPDHVPRGPPHNQLARNVNYRNKGQGPATTIGRESGFELKSPVSCAYHVTRDELYVADQGNDRGNARVMVCNTQGRNPRVFYRYTDYSPRDVAISEDGGHVYILMLSTGLFNTSSIVHKVSVDGQLVKEIDTFRLGELEDCRSIVCHNQHLAVLSDYHKCVIFYTHSGDYVRHFTLDVVGFVTPMAVDNDSKFYITGEAGPVHVYTWDGQFQEKFGELAGNSWSGGISVDGDGYVCVSRSSLHRIDVYDPQRRHVTSLGREGRGDGCLRVPCGLCMLPNGKLVVVDEGNKRLQIF